MTLGDCGRKRDTTELSILNNSQSVIGWVRLGAPQTEPNDSRASAESSSLGRCVAGTDATSSFGTRRSKVRILPPRPFLSITYRRLAQKQPTHLPTHIELLGESKVRTLRQGQTTNPHFSIGKTRFCPTRARLPPPP